MTHKSRKYLSIKGLLATAKRAAQKIPLQIKGNGEDPITLTDCIMSALAMFGLKFPSLLKFDEAVTDDSVLVFNLKKLYLVNKVPSDTYMRERLDEVDPKDLRKLFTVIFSRVQRGKALEPYQYIDGHYLLSIDGTGYFESKDISCDNCCVKQHRDGTKSYYHNMLAGAIVHPFMKEVIPFAPEPIIKEDGQTKNDSEQAAIKRFLNNLQREHPHLKVIITADSLHSTGPFIRRLQDAGSKFILNVKPGSHKALFEFIEPEGICTKHTIIDKDGNTYKYRYINNVPINGTHPDISVNFLECIETGPKGKKKFTWVTNIPITKHNIHQIMRGGRARWRIENETFNTLKNQGYQFEHNFGHGHKHLSTAFAMIMLLAFLIDQIQQLCDALFQAALKKVKRKAYLWDWMRNLFFTFLINSWEDLWQAIAHGFQKQELLIDTS